MFIYKVSGGYGAPPAAKGYYATPEGAAEAVTKQEGTSKAATSIFNEDGILKLIKGMTVSNNGISILNARVYKRTLK